MKKHILWATVAILLLYTGPALAQDNDDDKFAKPQIDVISDVDQTEPADTKSPQEKDQKRHPEDIGISSLDPRTETDATDVTDSIYTDMSEGADIDAPRPSRKSRRKRAAEEAIANSGVAQENQTPEKPPLEPESINQPPTQPQAAKPTPVNPQPTAQQATPQGQASPQGQAPSQGQAPQGQVPPPAKPNVPGQPGQVNMQQQAPAQEKAPQQPPVEQQQPNIAQPTQQQPPVPRPQQPPVNTQGNVGQQQPPQPQQPAQPQPPIQNQQAKPAEQVLPTPAAPTQQQQQANQHIPEVPPVKTPEPVQEPVNLPPPVQPAQPAKPAQPAQPAQPAAPVKQEPVKPTTTTPRVDDLMDEEQYLNLYGHEDNYLDKYTVYSETFYTHFERFCKEALVPIYHHIRTTPELSLGFSTLAVIYFVNLFFRILGRIFRKKPKFVYNKEEVMSHADINNNFKKFVAELDSLKKQLDTNAKKGGSTVAHSSGEPATPATATIPQSLQNEISYIAQNLSKNDDLFNKISKDRKQLDSFLFEFQKEVVESHKAIWNELYQLRKVFSQSRLNMSTSSLKVRSEARDTDDTKSLSSNPDTETRRREDREPVKKSTEPRSRSVAGPETGALRSRQPVPKERKPVQDVEPEKPASALQNGNSAEPHVSHTRKEEPHVEKAPAQDPFAAKQPEPEETQPEEVQIPTNLSDKAPTHNPFATSAQNQGTPTPVPVNQNAGPTPGPGPSIGMGAPKGIPFGVKGRPPVVKQPVIQTTFPHGPEPTAVNSGAKLEPNSELNSGLKPTTPTPVLNNMPPLHAAPAHAEPHQERTEEKSALPETDHAPEETKAAEGLSGADEMLIGGAAAGEEDGATELSSASRPGIPQLRGGPPPMGGPMGGPPGQRKPVIPTNKALPIPGRKPGLPGANVFKGPPGNIPRAAVPTQIKQPQGQVQDTAPKTGV